MSCLYLGDLSNYSNIFLLRRLSCLRLISTMPDLPPAVTDWPAAKVRDTFISFFEAKEHIDWVSSPVLPLNDPTLLFANAGLCFFFFFLKINSCHFCLLVRKALWTIYTCKSFWSFFLVRACIYYLNLNLYSYLSGSRFIKLH